MIQETSTPDTTTKRRHYWQAQSLAEMALAEFNDAVRDGDTVVQRREFYILANYYGRTLRILRTALNNGKEPLAQAVLQNLVTLHRPLAKMHSQAPGSVPLALSLDRQGRDGLVRDLIVRVLSESPEPLPVETVLERVNDLDILGTIRKGTVQRHSSIPNLTWTPLACELCSVQSCMKSSAMSASPIFTKLMRAKACFASNLPK
jgi:hypothetical protein